MKAFRNIFVLINVVIIAMIELTNWSVDEIKRSTDEERDSNQPIR